MSAEIQFTDQKARINLCILKLIQIQLCFGSELIIKKSMFSLRIWKAWKCDAWKLKKLRTNPPWREGSWFWFLFSPNIFFAWYLVFIDFYVLISNGYFSIVGLCVLPDVWCVLQLQSGVLHSSPLDWLTRTVFHQKARQPENCEIKVRARRPRSCSVSPIPLHWPGRPHGLARQCVGETSSNYAESIHSTNHLHHLFIILCGDLLHCSMLVLLFAPLINF